MGKGDRMPLQDITQFYMEFSLIDAENGSGSMGGQENALDARGNLSKSV